MEGYRYFDLVRWGQAPAVLNKYFSFESKLTTDVIGIRGITNLFRLQALLIRPGRSNYSARKLFTGLAMAALIA